MLFPAFAQYLADGLVRTRMPEHGEGGAVRWRNDSNEIDLCRLCGLTTAHTAALRLGSEKPGRRGRLKSQVIGDEENVPYLFDGGRVKTEFAPIGEPLGMSRFPDPALRAAACVRRGPGEHLTPDGDDRHAPPAGTRPTGRGYR